MSLPHNPAMGSMVSQLGRLFSAGTAAGLSDRELLDRFIADRDEGAFAAIMTRHGPMVLGVCRRLLRDPNDVDDAFQATFVILVRKARTLRRGELLANWLYGVAYRVSQQVRTLTSRRERKLRQGAAAGERFVARNSEPQPQDLLLAAEAERQIHAEVHRLPTRYRAPIVLCYLEGLSCDQAAAQLGCPSGTVKGRLSRGKLLLSRRLAGRGFALSETTILAQLSLAPTQAVVPLSLETATLTAAKAGLASFTAATLVAQPVFFLAQGVLQTMFWTKIKLASLTLLLAGGSTALAIAAYQSEGTSPQPVAPTQTPASSPVSRWDRLSAGADPFALAQTQASSPVSRSPNASRNPNPAQAGKNNASNTAQPAQSMPPQANGERFGGQEAEPSPESMVARENRESLLRKFSSFLTAHDPDPRNQAVWKLLERPVPMNFPEETTLSDLITYLRKEFTTNKGSKTETTLPIYVDPIGLGEAERTMDSTFQIELTGVPLRTTLRLILHQLSLGYCVRDGILIIASPKSIEENLEQIIEDMQGQAADPRMFGIPEGVFPGPARSGGR